MKGLNKQLGVFIAGSALLYALIPSSPAVSSSVKDTSKSFSNISLTHSKKQLAKSNKSQVPTQPQEKSNKQVSVTKSVQASVVQIQVGCTAKIYWADNSKTYYLTVQGSGSGFFVDSNGYIITMFMSLTSLRIQISASKAFSRILLSNVPKITISNRMN